MISKIMVRRVIKDNKLQASNFWVLHQILKIEYRKIPLLHKSNTLDDSQFEEDKL